MIFLIVTLFISCAYLLLSKNKKTSLNLEELMNEKRRTPISGSQSKQQNVSPSSRSLASPANSVIGYERNVLLVTNYFSKNGNWQNKISTDVLYNILKQIKKVTITILDPYDANLNSKGINYLKNFHLVAIDFVDGDTIYHIDAPTSSKLQCNISKKVVLYSLAMTNSMILIVDL